MEKVGGTDGSILNLIPQYFNANTNFITTILSTNKETIYTEQKEFYAMVETKHNFHTPILNYAPIKKVYTIFIIILPIKYLLIFLFFSINYEYAFLNLRCYGPIMYQIYPYRMQKFVALVPRLVETQFLTFDDILKSPLLSVWLFAIFIFTISRKLFQILYVHIIFGHYKEQSMITILFETIGLMFGTTGMWRIGNNKPDNLLGLFISIFGIIASIFCTGYLFEQFAMDLTKPTINSIEDLANQKSLNICVIKDLDIKQLQEM